MLNYSYDFEDEVWAKVSEEAKDLIRGLLQPSKQRLTAKQAFEHPFITRYMVETQQIDEEMSQQFLQRIKAFSAGGKLKQLTMNCIAHQCSSQELMDNQKIFIKLDKNNDGYITKKELREGLKQMMKLSDDEIEQIIRSMDTDKNGAINYTEFIAATLSAEAVDTGKIIQAFEMMDKNGDGYIDESELAEMVGQEVEGLDLRMLKGLIKEADLDGDQRISISEFKNMLLGHM